MARRKRRNPNWIWRELRSGVPRAAKLDEEFLAAHPELWSEDFLEEGRKRAEEIWEQPMSTTGIRDGLMIMLWNQDAKLEGFAKVVFKILDPKSGQWSKVPNISLMDGNELVYSLFVSKYGLVPIAQTLQQARFRILEDYGVEHPEFVRVFVDAQRVL